MCYLLSLVSSSQWLESLWRPPVHLVLIQIYVEQQVYISKMVRYNGNTDTVEVNGAR